MSAKRIVKIGERFNLLEIIKELSQENHQRRFLCKCACGKIKAVSLYKLVSNNTKSCGCYKVKLHTKHGLANCPEHHAWIAMKQRCYNTKLSTYHCYGGRGIRVCDRWLHSFENFLADMGKRPSSNFSIDRVDNDKGYEKSNCRWATRKEQCSNQRKNVFLNHDGMKLTISEWSRMLNIPNSTLCNRKRLNWSDAKIIMTPIRNS